MTHHQGQMLCIMSFAVSRFFYLGRLRLRFDESPLTYFLQYVDPQLLTNNLWESLYYLHSQPPGFNLFLGMVLKAFPESHALVFQCVFIGLGLLFALSLFTLMVQLGVSAGISAVLTIIFSSSPAVVLYEHWLFYTYPTAALLCFAAVLLHRFAVSTQLRTGLAFFSVLAVIAYIRGIFHLLWFAFFCLVIFYILREHRKKVALAFCLPLLVLGAFYAKNYFVFGSFNTSGEIIAALNLKTMSYYKIPEDKHRALIEQGKLTPMSLIHPDSGMDLGEIESFMDIIGRHEKTGVAILDQVRKSTGTINLDYVGFIKAAQLISKDNRYFLRERPDVYLKYVARNYSRWYFLPVTDMPGWGGAWWFRRAYEGRPGIQMLDRLFSLLFLGQRRASEPAYFLVVGFPLLLAFGFYLGAKAYRIRDMATFITIVFLIANILYVTLVTTFLSDSDHNRYRFKVDAFYLTLLGLVILYASTAVKVLLHKRKAHHQMRNLRSSHRLPTTT